MKLSEIGGELCSQLTISWTGSWKSKKKIKKKETLNKYYRKYFILESSGLLDNTFVIFTSDHGYHLGQFGLPLDKRQLYETDIRVPLLVRGPGISRNYSTDALEVNVDLAPTIIDMAGLKVPSHMDGTSFLPHAKSLSDFDAWYESNDVNFDLWDSSPEQQHSFLVSYHGEHDSGRDPRCVSMTDSNMTQCEFNFGCKCQDVRNNTYSCVRSKSRWIAFDIKYWIYISRGV